MSIESILFNLSASRSDRKRDKAIPIPEGVSQCRNISYGHHGKWNLLDVYFPNGTNTPLPTIVSIHGGGYVYGNTEIYRRYCMDLARRGFSVVNFNYRLAPKWKFPAPLEDTNTVLHWIYRNAAQYHLDPDRIILIGDSAGAQLASQYAAIAVNPDYAAVFDFQVPSVQIRVLCLNCGLYDPQEFSTGLTKGLVRDYLGPKPDWSDPRLRVLDAIHSDYPPTFLMTAHHDFLRDKMEPMANYLKSKRIPCEAVCFGSPEDTHIAHVFHVNIVLPEAKRCNDMECIFFRKYL